MHYNPSIDLAFSASEHITRDVEFGWLLRYTHANAVSMFFILVFIHIGRGLYYGSYRQPRATLWIIGVIIFIIMMGT
jgi:ubiquinol-cytochrome c reductase cytochrome b subunit